MIASSDKLFIASELTKSKYIKYGCGHPISIDALAYDAKQKKIVILKQCEFCRGSAGQQPAYNLHEKMRAKFNNGRYVQVSSLKDNSFEEIKIPYTYGLEIECLINVSTINCLADNVSMLAEHEDKEYYEISKILRSLSTKSGRVSKMNLSKSGINTSLSLTEIQETLTKWVCGGDGSITNSDRQKLAFELKSHILLGDKGFKYVKNIIELLNPSFNSSTGLHIHVKPDYILSSDRKINISLLALIYDAFYFSRKVASNRLNNSYAPIRLFEAGDHILEHLLFALRLKGEIKSLSDTLRYCTCAQCEERRINELRQNQVSDFALYNFGLHSHYSSTSFSSHKTIEFRLLQGTKDLNLIKSMTNDYMALLKLADNDSNLEIRQKLLEALGISSSTHLYEFKSNITLARSGGRAATPALEPVFDRLEKLLSTVM